MSIIKLNDVRYSYIITDENDNIEEEVKALTGVSLDVREGEFIAVLGRNGSGKSTLAKLLNGILIPTEGDITVAGMNTKDEDRLIDIRRNVGMVFQNPDNQIIANVVEEDVAFGPENLGIPTDEIVKRVAESLDMVGMSDHRLKSPNKLSGGQKQRIAIAGVMAMRPKVIVLDEPTAMLDPDGRRDVLETAKRLNKEENITIILITHNMDEVHYADRVVIIDKGEIAAQGTPREIFSDTKVIKDNGLDVPQVTELAEKLGMPKGILTVDEFIAAFENR